jgi:hypothetical protein
MGQIIILKDVNKAEENDYNTIKIKISKFKFKKTSDNKRLIREKSEDVLTVKGWSDNKYSEKIETTWDSILGSSAGGKVDDLNKLLSLVGVGSLRSKAMYTQVWVNSKPTTFEIPLTLIANKDPIKEVQYPIRKLQSMIVPVEKSNDETSKSSETIKDIGRTLGIAEPIINMVDYLKQALFDTILSPPNASTLNLVRLGANVEFEAIEYIEIGRFIRLQDIVLQNVQADWDMDNQDYGGVPKSAKVTLSIQSKDIWTNKTINNLNSDGRGDVLGNIELLNPWGIPDITADKIKDYFKKG